jgi:hypothetical protein
MADLAFSNLQNNLIAAKALEVLTARRSPLTIFTSKIADDANASAVYVPYASGFTANRGFGGTGAGTLTGTSVTFGEPYVSSTPVTPNVLTSGFTDLVTNIIPAQVEAVMIAIEQGLYGLVNATNFPVQVSSSTVLLSQFDSGSNTIRTSGSNAQQYTLVSEKYDTQTKAILSSTNVYVQADVLTGKYIDTYKVQNSIVFPTSNLATYATGSDAVTLIPDAIVWASKPVDVRSGASAYEQYGISFVTYLDQDPVTHKLWVQTGAQVAMGAGRVGFGVRHKIN